MAGLGTGAAPFRAFLQHRAALAEKGLPAGPAYYYFGSRKQSEEYLYGEEVRYNSLIIFDDLRPFRLLMTNLYHQPLRQMRCGYSIQKLRTAS